MASTLRSIKISEDLWKRLMKIKSKKPGLSFNDVINELVEGSK